MKTIYKIYQQADAKGKWFKAYDVADDFPLDFSFTDITPTKGLLYPRFVAGRGWGEDKDQLILSLNQQILDGQTQIGQLQSDLLDMMELVSNFGGEASV